MTDSSAEPEQSHSDHVAALAQAPVMTRYLGYLKLSGPGFMQSACTIGGGTLAACMFLGSIAGVAGLWVQPLSIVIGAIALAMIAHVSLHTSEDPLRLMNRRVSPVLGWGWLIATVAANMIWGLPQYNLAVGAITENIVPSLKGSNAGRIGATAAMAVAAVLIIWTRGSGGQGNAGVRLFELLVKLVIAAIVLCFGAVVVSLAVSGTIDFGALVAGLVPNPSLLWQPAATFTEALNDASAAGTAEFWTERIVSDQRKVIFAAIGAAVGINMTFLMPYALRERKWGAQHGGLARFDLMIGMMIPFVLVTTFVITATAFTLHGKRDAALESIDYTTTAVADIDKSLYGSMAACAANQYGDGFGELNPEEQAIAINQLSAVDRQLAVITRRHGNTALAVPMAELFGDRLGNIVFGVGVFFIALSTVVIHMTINGYALHAGFGIPHRVGALLPLVAVSGPFVWGDIGAFLAVPTSVIGLMLMPLALWGFFLLATNRRVLGERRLGGVLVVACLVSVLVYTYLSVWSAYGKIGWYGPTLVAVVAVLALLTSPLVRGNASSNETKDRS